MAGCSGCHRPKLFKSLVDLCQETHRIEPQVLVCQYVALLLGQHIRVQESSVWSLGRIIHFVNPSPVSGLALQLHHRLEEIDVASDQPVYPFELVQSLFGALAVVADQTAHHRPVLLLHIYVFVLFVRPAASEGDLFLLTVKVDPLIQTTMMLK